MATISENLQILKNSITSIKQAIINKCGNVEGNITTYADYINSINTNIGDNQSPMLATISDVNFYDYDGTILYSYTKEQFLALSAMPKLQTRDGLICQKRNCRPKPGGKRIQCFLSSMGQAIAMSFSIAS